MTDLAGKVAWITGAGSGIGEAAALMLAKEGVAVALTSRGEDALNSVAKRVESAGGRALVVAGDLSDGATADRVVSAIKDKFGRLDILVNNAGTNVRERSWREMSPERVDFVLKGNLANAYYCSGAVLPIMREQQDGVLIHTASWAGKFTSPAPGTLYCAAKSAMVTMSYGINMEEFANGIRSTVLCPGEVSTPILDRRPGPKSTPEERARMLQPEDMADLILYVAKLPKHVCISEVVLSPTWNRSYASGVGRKVS